MTQVWMPATLGGNPDAVPGSWFQLGSATAFAAIWVNEPVVEELSKCLSPSANSASQINVSSLLGFGRRQHLYSALFFTTYLM